MLQCLPEKALADVASHARRRAFLAGEAVFEEGDVGHSLFVVCHGTLKVVRPTHDASLVLDRMTPGEAFGELAIFNSAARSASVIALEECETIEIRGEDLERVLDANPGAARHMLGQLAGSLTAAKEEVSRYSRRLEAEVRERTAELRDSQLEVVRRLTQAAESRDLETGVHITRMSRMASHLALAAGAAPSECELLLHAAPMHDVGKIAIPDSILLKPGRLTPEEWEVMKTHAELGARLLEGSPSPVVETGRLIALTHHERWDGTGYPQGLKGEEVPFVARLTAVCDVFDALISERPYKSAWPLDEALSEIKRQSGRHFDPELVRVFVQQYPEIVRIVEESGGLDRTGVLPSVG
jgi:HD-GYP domain-containing protein (c-di-GMP phosphodiesterase class II)